MLHIKTEMDPFQFFPRCLLYRLKDVVNIVSSLVTFGGSSFWFDMMIIRDAAKNLETERRKIRCKGITVACNV